MQGEIGDCYFLSALAVLGGDRVKKLIITIDNPSEWKQCGAFCVRFFDGGQDDIVIIDDHFPVFGGTDLCFTHSPDGKELWPAILEKAYAKKYGSYTAIWKGHTNITLTELTNGVSEIMSFKKNKNMLKVWNELLSAHKNNATLGAGSPSHPKGDRGEPSAEGIVPGHAYSILRL